MKGRNEKKRQTSGRIGTGRGGERGKTPEGGRGFGAGGGGSGDVDGEEFLRRYGWRALYVDESIIVAVRGYIDEFSICSR